MTETEIHELYKKYYGDKAKKQRLARNAASKKWRAKLKNKTNRTKPENREKRKIYMRKYLENPINRKKHNQQLNNKYVNNPKFRQWEKQRKKNYSQTKKGKEFRAKYSAKRHRNLDWIKLFDNTFDCSVEWHHISDAFVFAVPKEIHKANLGSNHQRNMKPIVEELYNISYVIKERQEWFNPFENTIKK